MKTALPLLLLAFIVSTSLGQDMKKQVGPLINSSCIGCHDGSAETELNFDTLGFDFATKSDFDQWVHVYDRIAKGEMPPASEARPDPAEQKLAMESLAKGLRQANIARQKKHGRAASRRLTKNQLGHTLRDLFVITGEIVSDVPDEMESGTFDTVGANQRISALHMESYLKTADAALDRTIRFGPNLFRKQENDFEFLTPWHNKPLVEGGSVTRALDTGGVALFVDTDYLTGFHFPVWVPGIYRLNFKVSAYQSKKPLTAKLIIKKPSGNAMLAKTIQLQPNAEPEMVSVEAPLRTGRHRLSHQQC